MIIDEFLFYAENNWNWDKLRFTREMTLQIGLEYCGIQTNIILVLDLQLYLRAVTTAMITLFLL